MSGADLQARGEDTFGVCGLRTGPTGVVGWPPDMTFEEWDELGLVACEARDWTAWFIGDWLRFGEDRWHDRYTQARALSNRSYGGLRNCLWVARKIPPPMRRESLSWSHHRLVARFDDEAVRDDWLDRAEAEGWTVDLLESMLRDAGLVAARLQPVGEAEVVAAVGELRHEYTEPDPQRVSRIVCDDPEPEHCDRDGVELPPMARQLEVGSPSLSELVAELVRMPRDEHGRICVGSNLLERLQVALERETS